MIPFNEANYTAYININQLRLLCSYSMLGARCKSEVAGFCDFV